MRKTRPVSFIEPLEARIAPATLVNPTTVTFQDSSGQTATVTISKGLFTSQNVNHVFGFNTGAVTGDNSAMQQLQLLDIDALGHAARGISVSITAASGTVDVGFIDAGRIDLGDVTVGGDLGRIDAGDFNFSTQGLHSLTVDSLGAQGLSTQQSPGGNLNSLINGPVGSIMVNGDIDGASVGIGGGHKGMLGSLTVTGSINGEPGQYAGSVRTQGGIGSVLVDGSITGGSGPSSGIIGTAGLIGTVVVDGSVVGGAGAFSGAILSTGAMGSVQIDGSITGGSGQNSGEVGTASNLSSVTVLGSVTGGSGQLSGVILAGGNITTVTVANGLIGGTGASSGQIGAGKNITTVDIGSAESFELSKSKVSGATAATESGFQGVYGGPGAASGSIVAGGSITTANIYGYLNGYNADSDLAKPSVTISAVSGSITAGGSIQSVYIGLGLNNAFVLSGGSIGSFTSNGEMWESIVQAKQNIGSVWLSGSLNFDLSPALIHAADVKAGEFAPPGPAVYDSGFNAGGSIGTIDSYGDIQASVFIAGDYLGTAFDLNGAGDFSNIFNFGISGGKSSVPTHIGDITIEYSGDGITQSTFLAGVQGAGANKTLGTNQDQVPTGSSIGTIISPNGLNDVWFESGSIGATTSGEIVNSTYIATDTAVSAGGIGPISVTAYEPFVLIGFPIWQPIQPVGGSIHVAVQAGPLGISSDVSHGIYNSTFISNAGIGPIYVSFNGEQTSGEDGGISSSLFQAGHAIGSITVTNNAYNVEGTNYGIINTAFNAGLNGYGGIGDLNVSLTDMGPNGSSAAIQGCQFDASVCSCMSANMGSISVTNADTGSSAAGIVDSVFRVHGSIGSISSTMESGSVTAPAIQGSVFSAFGSIGDINVYGAVLGDESGPSRFLAGYDIGSDMTFGNEDLSATSTALQAGQEIGNVTVTGYFEGSDIIASVNPGAGYVFGSSTNTNVGSGGSIGFVNLATEIASDGSPFVGDHATSHAIEAANFATGEDSSITVAAFNYTSGIPVVLYVDGGSNDVRITNLQPAT